DAVRRMMNRAGSPARTIQLLDRLLKNGERGSFRLLDALTSIARTEGVNLREDSIEDVVGKVRAKTPDSPLFSNEEGDGPLFTELAVTLAKMDPGYMALLSLKTMEAGQAKTDLLEAARIMARAV